MLSFVKNFVREEEGATMIEYGLMVALIAVVIMGTVAAVGTSVNGMFQDVDGQLSGGATGGTT
jgi:pilus assembly protein Flp/PilA